MFGNVGFIKTKATIHYTDYFWGPVNEIENRTLPVLEQNTRGDCLCMAFDKGLVDVDYRDIEGKITL